MNKSDVKISNRKKVAFLKKLFFMVSILIAIIILIFFMLDLVIYALVSAGIFLLWLLYFQVADYQYIEFAIKDNKILLRYYKIIRLGKTEFNAIEFPQNLLYNIHFENSVFGRLTDLTIIIKTRRGIAEYPSVSLTALTYQERMEIKKTLYGLLGI
jgi:hypothetical protein